ncbi:hypothetical protein GCM10027048_20180 [Hymenobacter coalescens]
MHSLVASNKSDEAFNYGFNILNQLKVKNKRDYNLEALTWMCLSASSNTRSHVNGCQALRDYLLAHNGRLAHEGTLNQYKVNFTELCNNRKPISAIGITASRSQADIKLVHKTAGLPAYAGITSNFKTYINLRHVRNLNLYFQEFAVEQLMIRPEPISKLITKPIEVKDTIKAFRAIPKGSKNAMEKVKRIFPNTSVIISNNFILISPNLSASQMDTTCELLEKTLAYYTKTFELEDSENFITVFLSKNSYDVDNDINKIHQISIDNYILGFTDHNSYSIVAWLPSPTKIGTLKHELIHLLLHNKLLLSPTWIEEGLATLFEESRFINDELIGVGNWRGDLLKSVNRLNIPTTMSLIDAVTSEDSSYNNIAYANLRNSLNINHELIGQNIQRNNMHFDKYKLEKIEKVFITNLTATSKDALSRYLFMYLQSTNNLSQLYPKLQKNELGISTSEYSKPLNVFLQVCGSEDYTKFKFRFINWLREAPGQGG